MKVSYNICFVACTESQSRWAEVLNLQFLDPLVSLGHMIITICPFYYKNMETFNSELTKSVIENKIDVLFCLDNEKIVYKRTLLSLKAISKTVLILTDNSQNPFPFIKISKYYDFVWFLDYHNQELFNVDKARRIYLPWGFNINCKVNHYNYKSLIPRVVFIGSIYGSRVKLINDLLHHNIPVDLYLTVDNGLKINTNQKIRLNKLSFESLNDFFAKLFLGMRMLTTNEITRKLLLSRFIASYSSELNQDSDCLRIYERVSYSKISELYQSYRLVLNSPYLNSTGFLRKPVEVINLRTMEIVGFGGLLITQKSELIKELFTDKEEIVVYNKNNLKEVFNYYLYEASDLEIIEIRMKAQKKLNQYHTWEKRYNVIFDKINSSIKEQS